MSAVEIEECPMRGEMRWTGHYSIFKEDVLTTNDVGIEGKFFGAPAKGPKRRFCMAPHGTPAFFSALESPPQWDPRSCGCMNECPRQYSVGTRHHASGTGTWKVVVQLHSGLL